MRLIPSNVIQRLAVAAEKDGEFRRYALNAIHVEETKDNGYVAVATDGRMLLRVTGTSERPEEFPKRDALDAAPNKGKTCDIAVDAALAAAKATSQSRRAPPVLSCVAIKPDGKGGATLGATDLVTDHIVHVKAPKSAFPPYDKVFPAKGEKPVITVGVDVKRLAALAKAMEKIGNNGGGTDMVLVHLSIYGDGKSGPMKLTYRIPGGPEVVGLIMPCNMD